MITNPSTSELLAAVRKEIVERVVPAVQDQALVMDLTMMAALLDTLVVRSEHEIAWMREETQAVTDLAEELLGDADHDEALAAVVDLLRAGDGALHLSDVRQQYNRASEVLSRLAEWAHERQDPSARARVRGLLQVRLAHQQRNIGIFSAVGR